MRLRILEVTGERHQLSEDFSFHSFNASRLKLAVGDWASNLRGGPYEDGDLSKKLNATPGKNIMAVSSAHGSLTTQ